MKKLILGLGFICALIIASGYLFLSHVEKTLNQKIDFVSPQQVDFKPGTTLNSLTKILTEKKLLKQPDYFKNYIKLKKIYPNFQAGPYRFEAPMSTMNIIQDFSTGNTYTPLLARVTIPEGFNIKQIAARLAAQDFGTQAQILSKLSDPKVAEKYGLKAKTLEGFIYPATYDFHKEMTVEAFLDQSIGNFKKNLPPNYEDKIKKLKLSLYDAVKFASLIELETQLEREKPIVSEVIWNRLNANDLLGIDAALIYGIKNYNNDIKTIHLRDRSNPYNNRIHRGLPPTPIGSPSISSLEAVINPSSYGYYFYVLKPGGGKEHHFSKTLAEHNRWVKKLISQ